MWHVKEVQNNRSSHPCHWQLAVRFTAKPPSECYRIRKMGEPYPQGFQKSLLCLQNCEVNNNNITTYLVLNIFRSALFDINSIEKTTQRALRLSSEWAYCCDGSVIDQTILNKQARVLLQGSTHHRAKSLLLAYKLWNQSAPSVHSSGLKRHHNNRSLLKPITIIKSLRGRKIGQLLLLLISPTRILSSLLVSPR